MTCILYLQHLFSKCLETKSLGRNPYTLSVVGFSTSTTKGKTNVECGSIGIFVLPNTVLNPQKVIVKVFDKLTGGKREKDRIHQDGDEFIELRLRPGDAYEMDGVRETLIRMS